MCLKTLYYSFILTHCIFRQAVSYFLSIEMSVYLYTLVHVHSLYYCWFYLVWSVIPCVSCANQVDGAFRAPFNHVWLVSGSSSYGVPTFSLHMFARVKGVSGYPLSLLWSSGGQRGHFVKICFLISIGILWIFYRHFIHLMETLASIYIRGFFSSCGLLTLTFCYWSVINVISLYGAIIGSALLSVCGFQSIYMAQAFSVKWLYLTFKVHVVFFLKRCIYE